VFRFPSLRIPPDFSNSFILPLLGFRKGSWFASVWPFFPTGWPFGSTPNNGAGFFGPSVWGLQDGVFFPQTDPPNDSRPKVVFSLVGARFLWKRRHGP